MSSSSNLIRSSLNRGREGAVLIGLISRAQCQTEHALVALQVCWMKENQKRSWEAPGDKPQPSNPFRFLALLGYLHVLSHEWVSFKPHFAQCKCLSKYNDQYNSVFTDSRYSRQIDKKQKNMGKGKCWLGGPRVSRFLSELWGAGWRGCWNSIPAEHRTQTNGPRAAREALLDITQRLLLKEASLGHWVLAISW